MKNKYYAIFGVVFLLLSLAGAFYLVTQNAENRGLANLTYDQRREAEEIAKLEKKVKDAEENPNIGDSAAAQRALEAAQAALEAAKKAQGSVVGTDPNNCSRPNIWCAGCGGFCSDGSQTCDSAIYAKCGEMPQRGGNYVLKPSTGCSGTYYYECTCTAGSYCFDRGTYGGMEQCTNAGGLCDVAKITAPVAGGAPAGTTNTYYCPGQFIGEAGASQSCTTLPKADFNINCYCGTIQVDTVGGGFKSQSMKCGCTKDVIAQVLPTNIPVIPTATPTRTIPTPTGTYIPTNTPIPTITPIPTNTLVPTNTPVPTATPTPAIFGCGYTPCDDNNNRCSSGLTCITANNNNRYCSQPQYTNTCKTNPGYTGCCTAPIVPTTPVYAQGPSPTRIILPVSGFEFPSQALTIIGGIATLLGFLILL